MKIKYLRLTKEQRKEIRTSYYKTNKGKALKSKLRLVLISSIGLFLCFLGLTTEAILNNGSTWDYVYAICVLFFAIFFMAGYYRIRFQRLNEYALKEKTKNN